MPNFHFMALLLYSCYKVRTELSSFYKKTEVRWRDNDNLSSLSLRYFRLTVCRCLTSMNFLSAREHYAIVIKPGVCFGCIRSKESSAN